MRLIQCPKCGTNAYERFETTSICHACKYNSIEGYDGATGDDKATHRLFIERGGKLPNYEREINQSTSHVVSRLLFSKRDRKIVRMAIRNLPPLYQAVLKLKFWKGFTVKKIARLRQLSIGQVDSILMESYAIIRDRCLVNQDFSINRLRRQIEVQLAPGSQSDQLV